MCSCAETIREIRKKLHRGKNLRENVETAAATHAIPAIASQIGRKLQWSDVEFSETLASLGIIGAQFWAPLKPAVHHSTIVLRELGPHQVGRR